MSTQLLSHVWLFATPWTVVHQAPLSKDFWGKNTGVACHFLLQGIFPTQGMERLSRLSPALQADSLPAEPPQFSQFGCSFGPDSLLIHGLHYARLPCPSPTPGVYSNSCPLSRWYHPTISSSIIPFSSCLQSFPASGCFPVSQFFTSGGQSIGISASASVLPVNIQDWFPLGLACLISLHSKGLSWVFSTTIVQKYQFFDAQLSLWSNSHIHTWLLEKP